MAVDRPQPITVTRDNTTNVDVTFGLSQQTVIARDITSLVLYILNTEFIVFN